MVNKIRNRKTPFQKKIIVQMSSEIINRILLLWDSCCIFMFVGEKSYFCNYFNYFINLKQCIILNFKNGFWLKEKGRLMIIEILDIIFYQQS